VREAGDWKLDASKDYPFLHVDVETEVPVAPALVDELVTLGKQWALAHPEEFEKASREEFRSILSATADWTFEELLHGLKLGHERPEEHA
jgi:hypothetical protein